MAVHNSRCKSSQYVCTLSKPRRELFIYFHRRVCHWKEGEVVPAWCKSANFVPGKIQLVSWCYSYEVYKTYCDSNIVYLFTDILEDTITPYNVSSHPHLFAECSAGEWWSTSSSRLFLEVFPLLVSHSLCFCPCDGGRLRTANASKRWCSLNVVVWSQLTSSHRWDVVVV